MGTRTKTRATKNKRVEITPAKLNEIKVDVAVQTQILMLSWLMDEFGYDRDKIVEAWDGVARYADAVKEKIISMDKVCNIINEHTGLNIKWNNRR